MTKGRLKDRIFDIVLLTLCAAVVICTTSCASNESKARKTLQDYLKPHGATDVVIDLFYVDPNNPDKAYTSATVTYSFATAEGKPQREFIGFVMAKEGDGWRIERNVSYTKVPTQAAKYLAGGK